MMAQASAALARAASATPILSSVVSGVRGLFQHSRLSAKNLGYESAAHTRRTLHWHAPTSSANHALSSLATLRDRSRAATRNDGYAKSAVDKLVSNIIGTGIKPMSLAPDQAFREAVHRLWLQWTDQSDADGNLDFYGQQSQATRAWVEGGESFGRLRLRLASDGLVVPLQVQVLDPEFCPSGYSRLSDRIRAGIEFDQIGRKTAYWFHASRPEKEDEFGEHTLRRVPVDGVLHMFEPLRPGQLRGVPMLSQALIALNELSKFSDAVLVRQQLSNMFMGFVRRPVGAPLPSEDIDPLTGKPVSTVDGRPTLSFEPGLLQDLADGEELQFSDPPKPDGYGDFMRQVLFEVSAATGVPYEVMTGDMRNVNDRTVRVILNEFRRRLQQWQHQVVVFMWCRPIWRAWMDRAVLSGALVAPDYTRNREAYLAAKWVPQGWPYIHPVQDVQAGHDAVRAGFKSRAAVVSELGEDAEVIDAEQAADNARADALGLRHDSDGRTSSSASVAAPVADEPDIAQRSAAA